MKRIVRLTESDLTRIVRRVIMEQEQQLTIFDTMFKDRCSTGVSGGQFTYSCGGSTTYVSCSTKQFTDASGQPKDQPLYSKDANTMKFIEQQCAKG
jgi:hypothetical protein